MKFKFSIDCNKDAKFLKLIQHIIFTLYFHLLYQLKISNQIQRANYFMAKDPFMKKPYIHCYLQ